MPPARRQAEAVVGVDQRIGRQVEVEQRIDRAEDAKLPAVIGAPALQLDEAKVVADAGARRRELARIALDVQPPKKDAGLGWIGNRRAEPAAYREPFESRGGRISLRRRARGQRRQGEERQQL